MRLTGLWVVTAGLLLLALSGSGMCQGWPVTDVYVKVSQDDNGNFTTWTDNPAKWSGPNATWVRGRIRDRWDATHYGEWPDGKIVGMGPFHEQDPNRKYDMFYGVPPAGFDAYHMRTGTGWYDPTSKVYAGTNFFSGVSVSDIVTLQYSTQVTYRAHPDSEPGFTLWGQPPMIELTTDSGTTLQERTFIYKPWGVNAMGASAIERRWQDWECRSSDGWWEQLHTSSSNCKGNWQWLLTRYATKKLRAPLVGDYTDVAPDGLSVCNPSGTSFAVKLGAHRTQLDNPANDAYMGKGPWILEGQDVWAFFDKVVVGIAERDGQGAIIGETRYTFDFENRTEPIPVLAAMSNGVRKLRIVQSMEDTNLFVLYGRVVDREEGDYVVGQVFTIDDGSGPVRVIAPGHSIMPPNEFDVWYARVAGRLFNFQGIDPRFPYEDPRIQIHEHVLYSRPDLIHQYQ